MRGITLDFTMYYRVLVPKSAWYETKAIKQVNEGEYRIQNQTYNHNLLITDKYWRGKQILLQMF